MNLPAVTGEIEGAVRAAIATGKPVFVRMHEGRACSNCGGLGRVYIERMTAGPYRSPPSRATVAWREGAWWEYDLLVGACPLCNSEDRARRAETLWKRSGLEGAERDWRMEFVDGMMGKTDALAAVRALLALTPEPAGILTLYGEFGRGKTGLLKSAVAAFIRAGVEARYLRSADYLNLIRETYGDDAQERTGVIVGGYGGVRVLALDEVDRASGTEWARSELFALLDTRYARRETVLTLLATNTRPDQMAAEWHYLSSRLRDGERVPVGGADLRGLR